MKNIFIALLLLVLISCSTTRDVLLEEKQQLSFIQRINAFENKTPRVSALSDGVLLSWVEVKDGLSALKIAQYKRQQWSSVTTVAQGERWFINSADYAKVTALSDHHFVATWLQNTGDSYLDYSFKIAQSFDAGVTWSKATSVIPEGDKGEHGFVSVIAYQSKLLVSWIESQEKGKYAIKVAWLDGHNQWSKISLLDDNSCSCCHTDLAQYQDTLLLLYRNRTEQEIRDIALMSYQQQKWTESRVIHNDQWQINGCPVNGAVISSTQDGYAMAWFTAAQNSPRIQLKIVDATGGSTVIVLDNQQPLGYLDMVSGDDGYVIVSWLSFIDSDVVLNIQTVDLKTQQLGELKQVKNTDFSGFPSIAYFAGQLFISYATVDHHLRFIKLSL